MKNGLKRGGLSAQSRVGWPPSLTGKSEGKATRDTERETKRESEKKREKARENPGFSGRALERSTRKKIYKGEVFGGRGGFDRPPAFPDPFDAE